MDQRSSKYTLIAALYVSQAIPMGFFITAMPVILRSSGVSLERVGLFSAVVLPWIVKFLWAPAVDRWGTPGRHFLSWIVPVQTATVVFVGGLSGLDLKEHLPFVVGLSLVFMFLSATQDIASDGLAVRVLAPAERGRGNALQVAGYYLGQVLGGGLMLMAFDRFGWQPALLLMAFLLALPLLPASVFREPPGPGVKEKLDFQAMGRFFRRVGGGWIWVLLFFRAGEAAATFVFHQMLVEHGVEIAEIGLLSAGAYSTFALLGALAGGWLVDRFEGIFPWLAVIQGLAIAAYLLPAWGPGNLVLAATAMALAASAGAAATTALYAAMMKRSSPAEAATDFTLQQCLAALGPMLVTAASGYLVGLLDFGGFFLLCAGMSWTVALLLWMVVRAGSVEAAPPIV